MVRDKLHKNRGKSIFVFGVWKNVLQKKTKSVDIRNFRDKILISLLSYSQIYKNGGNRMDAVSVKKVALLGMGTVGSGVYEIL